MSRPARRRPLRLAALALAAATVAACGGPPGGGPARAAPPGVTPGGVLTVGITEPGSLDPAAAYDPASEQVLSAVCEPLLQYDPLTAQPHAGLASFWVITGNGSSLTVRLPGGVHYSNGGTVNAADVVSELSRVADVDTASYVAPELADVKGYDEIHGIVPAATGRALKQLTGLSALSDTSFSVSLARDDAAFIYRLGNLIAAPTPRGATGRPGFATQPVCAGPYQLAGPWKAGEDQIVLEQSPRYYGRDNLYTRGGRGYAARIVFKIYPSRAAAAAAFRAGQVDIALLSDTAAPAAEPPGANVVPAANGYVEYLGLPNGNPQRDVFSRPVVHQALSEALDRSALGTAAYPGTSQPATGFVPPTVADYQRYGCGSATPATGDVPAARAILARAGVDLQGQTLTLYYNDQFANAALARAIATQWQAAFALKVDLAPMPWSQYLQTATGSGGLAGAFLESWQSSDPSPDGYMAPLFSSASVSTDNFSHFVNADFERGLQTARQATTLAGMEYDYRQLGRQLCQQMPMVPLVFRQWQYLVRTSTVGNTIGSYISRATGLLDLREIYLH